jgi:hypothetical protein
MGAKKQELFMIKESTHISNHINAENELTGFQFAMQTVRESIVVDSL